MKAGTYVNAAVLAAGFAGLALALRPSPGLAQDAPAAGLARGSDTEQVRKIMEATKNNALGREINNGGLTRALELVEDGADVDAKGDYGQTALMLAAQHGEGSAVEFLIGKGADFEAENALGWTALEYAAANGEAGVVRILIDAGMDLDTDAAEDALRLAVRHGRSGVVRLLIDEGVDPDAVYLP